MTRVYHFVPLDYGLQDMQHRRLKIARINELNDPFELLLPHQADRKFRRAMRAWKKEMDSTSGLLCFCSDWQNPLMWSHYANRHTGLALGFDLPDHLLWPVSYTTARPTVTNPDMEVVLQLLFTKSAGWRYEKELRVYTTLTNPDGGHYFQAFNDHLVLREIIAGPLCQASEQELRTAAGSLPDLTFTKARLAFRSFRIVANRRGFPQPRLS